MKYLLLFAFITAFHFVYSQTTENIVTITTSGTGKTIEEAKNNALRSAIEQAFGAFISSKTEILNDELIKDEVVSISSGNILKFDVISEAKISENLFSTTLSSIVSITGLTTYCVSKGVQVEFKGSLFSSNLKLQKLNEEAEYQAVINLCETSENLLKKSIDFKVQTTEPIQIKNINGTTDVQIRYDVTASPNQNYEEFKVYFSQTARGLSMKANEVDNYKKMNKSTFSFIIDNSREQIVKDKKGRLVGSFINQKDTIILREMRSVIALQNLFIRSNGYTLDFIIENDIERININQCLVNCSSSKHGIVYSGVGSRSLDIWNMNTTNQSYPDFEFQLFFGGSIQRQSYNLYYTYLKRKGMLETFFNASDEQKWTTTAYLTGGDPLCPGSVDFDKIGVLYFNNKIVIKHYIVEQYSLDEIEKISFVKIVPL
jgi:hypothetical protein